MATIASVILSLGALVCWILIIIKMFQHDDTTMGIVCIVTTLCCGVGGIITLVYGWMKAGEWNMTNLMIAYTVCYLLAIVLGLISGPSFNPEAFGNP